MFLMMSQHDSYRVPGFPTPGGSRAWVLGAWLFLAACLAQAAESSSTPAGRIALDETGFSFGVVDQQTEASHVFTIRNTGAGVLRLLQVIPGCSCAVTELDSTEIPPGGIARLQVTLFSGTYNGPLNKTISIQSSDPAHPLASLAIHADVHPVFIFTPSVLDLGQFELGQSMTREVTLADAKGRPFAIKDITSTLTNLTTETAPIDRAGSTYRIKVTMPPQRRTGPMVGSLVVTTDRKVSGKTELVLIGTVIGPLRVSPTAVFLGMVVPGGMFPTKQLTVQNTGPKAVDIRSINPGDTALTASVTTNAPGRAFSIELTNVRPFPPGWVRRTLHVFTSDSAEPLEVSLSGIVRKEAESGGK